MEGSRKSEDIPLDSSSRAIMTNEVRWRRKITSNPCCSHCLTELETIIHALRDCPNARGVWDRIIEVADREAFYSLNWYTWLLNNLRVNHPSSKRKFWGIEFGIALWQIWKERNHRIFSSSTSPYTNTVQVIRRLMGDIIHSMVGESGFKDNTKQRVCIGWRYPLIDWVKINVDGCSKETQGWLELVESLGMLWVDELLVSLLISGFAHQ